MKYNQKMRQIVSIDKHTKEQLEGVIVLCRSKKNPYSKGWIMNSQEALKLLAVDEDLTGESYKVLLYLLSILDFENWIQIPQKIIAEELGMQKQRISRSIKVLEQKEIILRGDKLGRSYAFRLNPYFGWKGKVENLDDYREEKEQKKIKNLKEKTNKKKNQKVEALSKKYNIPIEEIRDCLAEDFEI